jgi:hypothetical protein
MIGNFVRFDMARPPMRQWRVLTPVTWVAAFPRVWVHRSKVDKSGVPAGLKPPYFLLCNHNSFLDMNVTIQAIFPHRANYVVAVDGFIGIEGLLRRVGGIGTRKFVHNSFLVKNMLSARQFGDIVVMYPEARYSLCGTSSELPYSLGKMVASMNLPVVTLIMHGHHVDAPFWHGRGHRVRHINAEMKLLVTKDESQSLPIETINERLADAFTYDDFAWQKTNDIKIADPARAQGLHKVLYQCPSCKTEYEMASQGTRLCCTSCGKSWQMGQLGDLAAESGETEFAHIPDWYEWERANVRAEIDAGTYGVRTPVRIESLPNSKGFVTFTKTGQLCHDMDGFSLAGEYDGAPFTLHWPVKGQSACHIEYAYKGRGDCVDLSTMDDSFYLFPLDAAVNVTKIALATEELFRAWSAQAHAPADGGSLTDGRPRP